MSAEFARILRGLMENRRLSPRTVSRASGRADSTINLLLNGSLEPSVDVLHDLAPILEMPLADLLVIAGVSGEPTPDRPPPYAATAQIGKLVAVASHLTPDQVGQLVDAARSLRE